tara:strand:+ start:66 stop:704 length:639 start_codon:yes stop_codon:yes gene_type:complete
MIKKSIFEQNAELYVEKVIMINDNIRIVDIPKYEYEDENSKITLNISGEYVSKDRINDWKRQLVNYDLVDTKLKINNLTQQEIDEAELLGTYLKDRDNQINTISHEKDSISSQRDSYKDQLNKINNKAIKLKQVSDRIRLHFDKIVDLNYGETFSNYNGTIDTIYTFIVKWDTSLNYSQSIVKNKELKEFIGLEMKMINLSTKNINVFQDNN